MVTHQHRDIVSFRSRANQRTFLKSYCQRFFNEDRNASLDAAKGLFGVNGIRRSNDGSIDFHSIEGFFNAVEHWNAMFAAKYSVMIVVRRNNRNKIAVFRLFQEFHVPLPDQTRARQEDFVRFSCAQYYSPKFLC
ncbi:hypothetical protein AGR4B_Lc10265 [Agrobacterium tumefaciens str. CFBP 5621]|nr:hypothetical protein AGR4B_Lc10265 [Agrobacterium tumefaciens str. CFBP 5621]